MNHKLYDLLSIQAKKLAASDMDKLTDVLRGHLEMERQRKANQTKLVAFMSDVCRSQLVVVPSKGTT